MATIKVYVGLVDENENEIQGGNYRRIPVDFVDGKMQHPVVFPPATNDWPPASYLGLYREETGGVLVATVGVNGGAKITATTQTIQEIGVYVFDDQERPIFESLFGSVQPQEVETIQLNPSLEAKIKRVQDLFEDEA